MTPRSTLTSLAAAPWDSDFEVCTCAADGREKAMQRAPPPSKPRQSASDILVEIISCSPCLWCSYPWKWCPCRHRSLIHDRSLRVPLRCTALERGQQNRKGSM